MSCSETRLRADMFTFHLPSSTLLHYCNTLALHELIILSRFIRPKSSSTSSASRAARRTRPRKAGAAERAPEAGAGAVALGEVQRQASPPAAPHRATEAASAALRAKGPRWRAASARHWPGWRGYFVCAPPPPKLAAGLLQHCAQGLCWTTPARAARWLVVS